MNKLLIISGPTATGKPILPLNWQKISWRVNFRRFRQIYQGSILGPVDHPQNIKIHFIDLITLIKAFP